MKVYFLLLPVCYILASIYLFFRLRTLLPPFPGIRWIIPAAGILLTLSPLAAVFGAGRFPDGIASVIYPAGTAWLIVFFYLFVSMLLRDLICLAGVPERLGNAFPEFFGKGTDAVRGFGNLAGALFLLLSAGILIGGYLRYGHKVRTEIAVATDRLSPGSDPLKIVFISDLHLGYNIGPKELSRWTERIRKEHADLILIGGDLIDNSIRPLDADAVAACFRQLDPPMGIYAVPGNHEYISGIEPSRRFFREIGIPLLQDTVLFLPEKGSSDGSEKAGKTRILLVGRDDRSNPRRIPLAGLLRHASFRTENPAPDSIPDLGPEFASGPGTPPIIVLDHQPLRLEESEQCGIDLQLSGHTHRGQIWPFSLLTDRIFECSYGYLKKGNTHFYISSGIGIWGGKFRIGTVSEYAVIRLVPAEK